MTHTSDPARRTAYDTLRAVSGHDAYANLVLPGLLAERRLDGRDAALATELAYGTLRAQGTYDAILAACVDRPLDRLDPELLDLLRLGTHQLLATRIPPHAAVAASVDLAREVLHEGAARMTNAVLRRVGRQDFAAWIGQIAPDPQDDPEGYLALDRAHPRWIVSALWDSLAAHRGAAVAHEEIDELLAADNAPPAVTLVARPGLAAVEDLLAEGAEPGRLVADRRVSAARRPRPARDGAPRPRRSAGRGQPAGRARPGRGAAGGARRAVARPVRGPGRQGRAARRDGREPRRTPGGRRAGPAPHPPGQARTAADPGAAQGDHRRRSRAGLASRSVRPRHRRRAVHRPRRAAPPSRGALAAGRDGRGAAGRDCRSGCSARRWTRRAPAAWSRTSPARRTWPRPAWSSGTCCAGGRTSSNSTRVRTCRECRTLGDGPDIQLWPHVHGTDAMYLAMLRRT